MVSREAGNLGNSTSTNSIDLLAPAVKRADVLRASATLLTDIPRRCDEVITLLQEAINQSRANTLLSSGDDCCFFVWHICPLIWTRGTNEQGRKSLLSCLVSGLRSCWVDPVAESSEFANHSCGALLLRPFSDSRAPFFVTDSLVQDQPD